MFQSRWPARRRYLTRPDAAGNPSRTSVNLAGDVAVANRAGGITKVYAKSDECPDVNGIPGKEDSEFRVALSTRVSPSKMRCDAKPSKR